jgi:hypothetical protein
VNVSTAVGAYSLPMEERMVKRYTATKFNSEGWDTPANEIGVFESSNGEYVKFNDYDSLEGESLAKSEWLKEHQSALFAARTFANKMRITFRTNAGNTYELARELIEKIDAALSATSAVLPIQPVVYTKVNDPNDFAGDSPEQPVSWERP